MKLTCAKFEQLTEDLLLPPALRAGAADAKLKATDIDEVVLVGGSTRMPMVQELVRKLTGGKDRIAGEPDEVVAIGAALRAACFPAT